MKTNEFFSKKGYPCKKLIIEVNDNLGNDVVGNAIVKARNNDEITVEYDDGDIETLKIKTNQYFGEWAFLKNNSKVVSALVIREYADVRIVTKIERIANQLKAEYGNDVPYDEIEKFNLNDREFEALMCIL